jgi:FKBP-type peptidyl-prolyl cis-trans isomerase FkpA
MIRKNFQAAISLLAAILMISAVACSPENKAAKLEQENIDAYLAQNSNLNFVKKPSGLYYYEVTAGTGISPVVGDSAWVKYTGKYLDGTIFDSNVTTGTLYRFVVGHNITGFDEGITLMKVGGKSTLLIPSSLAYGATGNYPYIAGFTPLLFDIELAKAVHPAAK